MPGRKQNKNQFGQKVQEAKGKSLNQAKVIVVHLFQTRLLQQAPKVINFYKFCVCSTWGLFLCNRLSSRNAYIFVSARFIKINCSKSISRAVVCCCLRLSKSGWKPNPFCWYTRTCVVISKRSCIVACFRLGIVMPVSVKFLRRKLLEN